ncbi:YhbD family protein [Bacillus atrophaeus]|jgi:DNA-binding transcriptional MerR regulator|uniref:YhbD family protein n=1 Tax=Bacillus atrophaeus TaxID=1452 RepID=UPI001C63A908|nr:YhbD family protein [Bacillus atrophaeus]MCY8465734.1 YhbD family protein [Bacillus atrophaeus]MCY8476721.1 YhbD family protein [Bacillus atrophaeus]MCY8486542.1 YhbD family protein [Bacillus atrophaeus]MCY8809182.1 YhbD family protein [Bacillus atrophaeus]MCY8841522.1 YhbD family protein [Bacillus atrophaeus]
MEEHEQLISKKDLLEETSISYGQLYRWKRKNLIPEEWFIRKSTFTGQETFFPREEILKRVSKIQEMKENLSLDEMRDMLSPRVKDMKITGGELVERGLISSEVLSVFLKLRHTANVYFSYQDILSAYVLEGLLQSGNISLDEGKMAVEVLNQSGLSEIKKHTELIILRKLGITTCFVAASSEPIIFEKAVKIAEKIDLAEASEELKAKLL